MDIHPENKESVLLKKISSFFLSLLVIVVAGLLVWQGIAIIADRAGAVETPPPTPLPLVPVSTLQMQDHYTIKRRFTGQIEAPQSANLSFESGGTLAAVIADEGDLVESGQILAALDDRSLTADVDRLIASRRALDSQLELASITNNRQTRLQQSGYTSAQAADQARLAVNELRARIAETDAAITMANLRLEKSKLIAPFTGAVNQIHIDAGNTVAGGQTIISVVEQREPIFRVGIDPQLSDSVNPEDPLEIVMNGNRYQAVVLAVLPQIDPATRTRIVRARVLDAPPLAFGLTGEAVFEQNISDRGAWVPLVALEQGIRGLWTLNTVSDTTPPLVTMEAVEVIHAETDRAYVRGTFADKARVIIDGVHRVVTGQPVRVKSVTAGS